MARITSTFFDLLEDHEAGIRQLESLVSDPSIIIESRSLRYIEAVEDEDTYEAPQLIMTVRYSKYGEVVSTDNYYKRVRLFLTFGFQSRGEEDLEKFLDSPTRIIDAQSACMNNAITYTVLEYIDKKYSLAGKEQDAGLSTKKLVRFDDYLQEYVPLEINEEE